MNNTVGTTPTDTTLHTNVARGSGGVDSTVAYYWQLNGYAQPYDSQLLTQVGDKFWIYTQYGIVRAKVHTVQENGTVLVNIKMPHTHRVNDIKWQSYDKILSPDECFVTKYEILDDVISRLL